MRGWVVYTRSKMQRSITKKHLSRKDAQIRRAVVQKLHQLECNGFDVWSYIKKDDNIFVYHSANRAGPPSSIDLVRLTTILWWMLVNRSLD